MNATRRKALRAIITKIEELESLRSEIREELEAIKDEEEESLGNMPESLQDAERGQQMQEYIDTMDDVLYDIEDIDFECMSDRLCEIF